MHCRNTNQGGIFRGSPFFYGEGMALFLDYDPVTGVRYDMEYDEDTGNAKISTSQDVSAAIDWAKTQANMGVTDKGIKQGFWKYATIPVVVQVALRNKGIDIYSKDPTMQKRVFREINENYAWCKTTSKHHA